MESNKSSRTHKFRFRFKFRFMLGFKFRFVKRGTNLGFLHSLSCGRNVCYMTVMSVRCAMGDDYLGTFLPVTF